MLTDSMRVACTLPRPSPRSQLNRSFENGGTGPQDTTALTEPKKGIKPTPCMEKLNRTGSQLESTTKELKDAKAEIETLTDRFTRLTQEGEGSQTVNAALTTTLESTKTELDACKADLEKAEDEIKLQAQKLVVEMECGVKLTTLLAKSENTINNGEVQIEVVTTRLAASESEANRLTGDVGDLATMRVESQSKSAVESSDSARLALSTATLQKDQLADQLASATALKDEFERKLTAAERPVSSISVEKLKITATQTAVRILTVPIPPRTLDCAVPSMPALCRTHPCPRLRSHLCRPRSCPRLQS